MCTPINNGLFQCHKVKLNSHRNLAVPFICFHSHLTEASDPYSQWTRTGMTRHIRERLRSYVWGEDLSMRVPNDPQDDLINQI